MSGGKPGRPIGNARKVAEATGVNIRMVQRALAPKRVETDDERTLRRFVTAFRNFATLCRENSPEQIGALHASERQIAKIREWNGIVVPWLQAFNGEE